jgi:hypothetical protein
MNKNGGDMASFRLISNIFLFVLIVSITSTQCLIIHDAKAEEGLIGYWKFDNQSNLGLDSSGYNNHGSVNNSYVSYVTEGKKGGAAKFVEGSNSAITIPNNSILNVTSVTIMAWVNLNGTNNDGGDTILSRCNAYSEVYALYADVGSWGNGEMGAHFNVSVNVPSGFIVPKDEWVHLAMTFDKYNARFYYNGNLVATKPLSIGIMTSNTNLYIGSSLYQSREDFSGLMDEVRLYNRALAEAEIKAIYHNDIEGAPSPPVLLAPSDNATQIDSNNILFEWQPCTDPDGDAVEYFICIREFGSDDNNVIQSYTTNNNFTTSLQPNKIYDWAVWCKDIHGNYSEPSDKRVFSTKMEENFGGEFNGLGFDVTYNSYESIYSIVKNCIQYSDYTYQMRDLSKAWKGLWDKEYRWGQLMISVDANEREKIKNWASYNNYPIYLVNGKEVITSALDATWGNEINGDNHFNTVFATNKESIESSKFEVISQMDEIGPPVYTNNFKCYYFTYDARLKDSTDCITIDSWINYLSAIKDNYKSIDILTIYAHGSPGSIHMSDRFILDSNALEQMKPLRNILSRNATILIFSCQVGLDEKFVQGLANATRATVYANSQNTGVEQRKDGKVIKDWELDVVKRPATMPDIFSLLLQE